MLRVSDGKSPIKGTPTWKSLNRTYAKNEKGGNATPNLELDGDLLDALEYKKGLGNTIEVGIFDGSQTGKADGHNNHTGSSRLPERRFIPLDDGDFYSKITRGIDTIILENKSKPKSRKPKVTERVSTEDETSISLGDILSDSVLTDLFGDYFGEG